VVVLLDPAVKVGGLVRDWPRPGAGVAVHHGYAFQWFALAATLIGIYVYLSFRKAKKRS
jgi:cytochrome oxidase assembly protein ShyY1